MNQQDLQTLIGKLYAACQEYWQLKFGRTRPEVPGQPADQGEINTTEQRLGRPLPPSLRQFLLLHRNWPYLVGDAGILSEQDRQNPAIQMQIRGFDEGLAPGQQAFVVVAGESSHYLAFLDCISLQPDGEIDVVEWTYEDGELERHSNFAAYLERRLEVMRNLVRKELGRGSTP
jgi:hypothetical protein